MSHLAPLGGVYQAGTLSGNPVAMAAGLATLRVLERDDVWRRLEERGAELERLLQPVLAAAPLAVSLVRVGSIFWLSLQAGAPPRAAEAIAPQAATAYRAIFHALLDRGVALAPSAYEVGFLSAAHRTDDLVRLAAELPAALARGAEAIGA
jgi:glutamate-1-semialdehyde 2,1-aminomutase